MKTPKFLKESYVAVAVIMIAIIMSFPFTMVSQKASYQSPLKPINEDTTDADKTLSPYFLVNSDNAEVDQLPLKSTKADVTISGVIADVKVTQVYMNSGKSTLEAIYVFPASTRAAVYDMRMTVGDRLLVAKIAEKAAARQQYEDAKSQGKTASLLEQERPNVFQMNVANIMPGDTIKVEMRYTELLVPESGIYEFVYPTVVGPRYSNKPATAASPDDKWVANPYTDQGVKPTYAFDIKVNLNAGMKIKAISCPTHNVSTDYTNKNSAVIKLKKSESDEGNRDFILQYKLAGEKVESGLLLYKGTNESENFFLAMIQPPAAPKIDDVPPRDFIFIMDVSGSMSGYPVETEKKLMKNLIKNLRPIDKFNVMLFAGSSSVLSNTSMPATEDNQKKAIKWVESQNGGGGTELLPALKQALALDKTEGVSRTFVISTDGYVDVEKEAFDLIKKNLNKANFFAFGVGTAVNRYIIEGMAHVGMGEPFIVTEEKDCDKKAEKFRKYIQTPVLTDVTADYGTFGAYDIEPLNIPDVLAERPIIIYGKWKGNATGTITIKGKTGSEDFNFTANVNDSLVSADNVALKYLWAREKIKALDDYNNIGADKDLQGEITALGLKYNLLTNYTSFVAIDSLIRNRSGKSTTVTQPLPLPDKVSNLAVEQKVSTGYYSANGRASNSTCAKSVTLGNTYSWSSSKDEEKVADSVSTFTMPAFIGGEAALLKFLKANIVYPAAAKIAAISGSVYLEFTIDANGNVLDVKVTKSLGYGCDEEAIRVIKLTSKMWQPATSAGVATSTTYTVVVKFPQK